MCFQDKTIIDFSFTSLVAASKSHFLVYSTSLELLKLKFSKVQGLELELPHSYIYSNSWKTHSFPWYPITSIYWLLPSSYFQADLSLELSRVYKNYYLTISLGSIKSILISTRTKFSCYTPTPSQTCSTYTCPHLNEWRSILADRKNKKQKQKLKGSLTSLFPSESTST